MSETVSLKVLARLVLERDTARDKQQDRVSRHAIPSSEAARQAPLAAQSASVVPRVYGEFGLEQPYRARRGRVQELPGGQFLHFCAECGRFGAFGYGVRLSAGRFGCWYCGEHRPRR